MREFHGKYMTRLYGVWKNMKNRCYNKSHTAYSDYGGRGIAVCDEWYLYFTSFMAWALAHGYTDELEIDRIDVNGNYEPSNCRFVTRSQNLTNTRKRSECSSIYKGVCYHNMGKKWMARLGDKYLGLFHTEIGAARAYDIAAKEKYGEFAMLNFPEKITTSI